MNPTPNILGQLVVVIPIILMYQAGIILVWALNRHRQRPPAVQQLINRDVQLQATRASRQLSPFTEVISSPRVLGRGGSADGKVFISVQ